MHILMIKKCMNTGLMYLCKTSSKLKDPFTYKGSGKRWLNHINKHNSRLITCVLGEFQTKEELKLAGIHFSELFDVVKNTNWANLTPESGDGGLIGTGQLGKKWKIKDTSNMKGPNKPHPDCVYKKIAGKNNYQFKGMIITPWGEFESIISASESAKLERDNGNTEVLTDTGGILKYIRNLDVPTNKEGRRTPKNWRGKTPREIGFNFIPKEDIKNATN